MLKIIPSLFFYRESKLTKLINRIFFLFFIALSMFYVQGNLLVAQLNGKIQNEEGEALAFASIYIKESTQGTFSNEDGNYELKLNPDENIIIVKYIGYATEEIKIFNDGNTFRQDFVLKKDNIILQAVTITPDKEDPAYEIIRKTIRARENFKNKPLNYKSRIYQKFQFELLNVPEKIMGVKVAQNEEDQKEIEAFTDSTNNVILVSEVISDYYRGDVNQNKEIIISSRLSGQNEAYSTLFSQFSSLDFYANTLQLGRKLVSPIASNALLFYDYKLSGSFLDEHGRLVNKIKVISKRKHDPVFSGFLFIVEDLWNIYGLDLSLNSKNTNVMLLDSIQIKQQFRQLENEDWALNSQLAVLGVSFFGFEGRGFHTKNILDFSLNQNFPDSFFDRIILKVEKESNRRDSSYWDEVRPIPLTIKEAKAYKKMDSIQLATSSKKYLDSLDRKENKFEIGDLIGSYVFRNSYKKYRFEIESPFFKTRFNPVQGFNSSLDLSYIKQLKNRENIQLDCKLDYGFADKNVNPKISWYHRKNNRNKFEYTITVGRDLVQPGEQEIMSRFINALTSLIQGKNYIHFYQKDHLDLSMSRHIVPGMDVKFDVEYANRTSVVNNSQYWFKGEIDYAPNIYQENEELNYPNKLKMGLRLSFRPGTKYMSIADKLQIVYSSKPLFYIVYEKAIGLNESFVDLDFIKGGIKGTLPTGVLGYSSYHLEGGGFLSQKRVDRIDDQYFPGNDRNYVKNFKYRKTYQLLPYYHSSGFKPYAFFKINHFLNGFVLSKIPLIRKLNLEEVITLNTLYLKDEKLYSEIGVGVNGLFRFANLRYSWGFYGNAFYDRRFTFSFNIPL